MKEFYGESIIEERSIVNRLTYKGRGRPRKTDYMNLIEAQRQINEYRKLIIDKMYLRS